MPAIVSTGARIAHSAAEGTLAGTVWLGPTSPHEPANAPPGRPVPGAHVDVATTDNKPVTSVVTDSNGNFKAKLPAGKYIVTMNAVSGARPRNMPASVTIDIGAETRLDIFLDTGLR